MLSKKKSNYKQFIFDYLFSKSTENQLQKMILFFTIPFIVYLLQLKKNRIGEFQDGR